MEKEERTADEKKRIEDETKCIAEKEKRIAEEKKHIDEEKKRIAEEKRRRAEMNAELRLAKQETEKTIKSQKLNWKSGGQENLSLDVLVVSPENEVPRKARLEIDSSGRIISAEY